MLRICHTQVKRALFMYAVTQTANILQLLGQITIRSVSVGMLPR